MTFFRLLLRLYPREFRERFEAEMVDFFLERRKEQRQRYGAWGSIRLWLHLVADIALTAPAQHIRALRRHSARELPWADPSYPQETHPMEVLRQDVRYALRALFRHPAFAIVAVVTLALGIGANTAIFSVIDAVLLRPLPWPDADRLVVVYSAQGAQRTGGVVYLDYLDWRQQSRSFEQLGVIRGQSINLTGGDRPDRLNGSFTNAAAMRAMGASTLQGRLFTEAETEVATRSPVAVISEPAWRTRFGSDPALVGKTLVLNGQPTTVIGITRAGFEAVLGTGDVWLPIGYYPNKGDLETRGRAGVLAVGKLKAGVSLASAQREMDAISGRIAQLYPNTNAGQSANLQPVADVIQGPQRTPLFIVLAAVGVVLLIACGNVANLQLARATVRRRELSVRAALGAGRRRLLRQLLTESLVLYSLGAVAGLGIAYGAVRWFNSALPNLMQFYGTIQLNPQVLGFVALVTLATGLLFGVVPALGASRAHMQEALTTRGDAGHASRMRAHNLLIVGEIALCVMLLVSAGLLTRSLVALSRVNPGFDAEHVLTMQFRLPVSKYNNEDKIADMFTRAIAELRATPGVERAALVRATPLNGNGETIPYIKEGDNAADAAKLPNAHRNIVSNDFFETMRIPRLSGRDFNLQDSRSALPVAIVNQQLAEKIAPNGDAIGKRVRLTPADTTSKWLTIIGVVGNAKHFSLGEQQLDQVYQPYTQLPLIFTEVVIRTAGDPTSITNTARAAIWRADPDQPVWGVRPVTLSIDRQLGSRRFTMRLLASFAILAVLLAMIGVYGVMSYAVARRTQEMGIRMALGAATGQVVGMVLKQGLRTVGIALALGLAASILATRLLESQLFGVGRMDPVTFGAAAVLLGGVAMAACYFPARRASRVDPVVALRSD